MFRTYFLFRFFYIHIYFTFLLIFVHYHHHRIIRMEWFFAFNHQKVFERGLEAIPLSVDLWIHYLTYVKSNPHHKPAAEQEQFVRSQFKRAVNTCGLEFRSDKLWDAYIKWENETKSYQRIVKIYDRLLTIPTQGYSGHFDK